MPLPGGPANKSGNRYEKLWTAYQLFRLLDGDGESIRLEVPGVDGAEFVIRRGDRTELHQVKRSGAQSWTVASLDAIGVLESMHELLTDECATFVFVSRVPANELEELCEAARNSESEEEFLTTFLKARSRRKPFERISKNWNRDASTVINFLSRIETRTIDERELENQLRLYARTLFLANPKDVVAQILSVVDDSTHKNLSRNDLIEVMQGHGFMLRQVADPGQTITAIRSKTTLYLEGERRKLIQKELISRQTTQDVLASIGNTATVLVGKAGAGKTACVVELVGNLLERKLEVLAFRLDRHVTASDTSDLGKRLGLEESPVRVLAAAAEESDRTAVLVVDQLDAISTMSGRNSGALDLVESLLTEVEVARRRLDLHVVLVCRSFDWDHDHRLRGLIDDNNSPVTIEEFTDEETRRLLEKGGFNPSLFSDAQLRLLRMPQNLSLFFQIDFDKHSTPDFNTVTELFERYWTFKRELVEDWAGQSGDYWEKALNLLCSKMTVMQELSVRREELGSIPDSYLRRMTSEGVLVLDGNRYGFGHESFFDYCYARILFFTGSESLSSVLRASEQHLFRRGQVRQVLAYVRDEDVKRYVSEVQTLLSDEHVRVHIKDLVFVFLAEVSDPSEDEWQIWTEWTKPKLDALEIGSPFEDPLSELALRRLFSSTSWFTFLVNHGVVQRWLKSKNEEFLNTIVGGYLRGQVIDAPNDVARVLEPYAESDSAWRLRLLVTCADPSASRRLFDLILTLIDKGTLDEARGPFATNSTFWDVFYELGTKRPEWVGEVIAHRIRRRLAILEGEGSLPSRHHLLGNDIGAGQMFLESAEGAPSEFVQHLLRLVLDVCELTADGSAPRRDAVWSYLTKSTDPNSEDGCLEALTRAITSVANTAHEEMCEEILDELRGRDTYVANHLLFAFYRGDPVRFAEDAASILCKEPWRFDCGTIDSSNWFAMETISAVAPNLSHDSLLALEDAILGYTTESERKVEARGWRGLSQFHLLSSIPEELRSANGRSRFQELERRFGEGPEEPQEITAEIVGPPISNANAEKMTDDQWLKAIKRYASNGIEIRDGGTVGGALELSRVLEDCVKNDPNRFALLAMTFDCDMNPVYMQRTLAGLSEADLDENLKIDVYRKAYIDARESCGGDIADAIGHLTGTIPEDVVGMMEWLATEHPDPEREMWQVEANSGQKYFNGDVYMYGFGTVRGRVARSITRLILANPSNAETFRPTIESMVKDRSSAVLSCVASIFEALAVTDPQDALQLFLKMDIPTPELLATRHVFRFMKLSLVRSFDELVPLIEQMIQSENRSVAKHGAMLAGLALLHGHEAEQLVATALKSGVAHRLGIAEVASSNLSVREYRDWCTQTLIELFDDEAKEVRRKAASCFRQLQGEPLEEYEELIDRFSSSDAFNDDSSTILRTLEESRQRLPGITCMVCERHLERFSDEARDFRKRRASETYTLTKLVFRTYQQHQDDEWSERTLNVIDQLCLSGLAGTAEQFEAVER